MTMIKLETFLLIKSNVHSTAAELLLKHFFNNDIRRWRYIWNHWHIETRFADQLVHRNQIFEPIRT